MLKPKGQPASTAKLKKQMSLPVHLLTTRTSVRVRRVTGMLGLTGAWSAQRTVQQTIATALRSLLKWASSKIGGKEPKKKIAMPSFRRRRLCSGLGSAYHRLLGLVAEQEI
jgi:hypothetical protein